MGLIRGGRRWSLNTRSPSTQNVVAGVGLGFSAGSFVSLNLLGAGGGRPETAKVIQTANAILSSVWFFSACIGGTYLTLLGPGITMCCGIGTYALYVGALWYYESFGHAAFPFVACAIVGIGAGAVFITSGHIQVAYSDEKNKGEFIAVQNSIQAVCTIVCSILPVILNRNNDSREGVPPAFYVTLIIIMALVSILSLLTLRRFGDLKHDDGLAVQGKKKTCVRTALRDNLGVFKDWKLLLMIPAFLPSGSFLIYLGSVNAFQNSLRARSLLSFIAVVVQIPFGHLLSLILDKPRWPRRTRGLVGLALVGIPLSAAWTWEIVRTRGFDRSSPPERPTDWSEEEFGLLMVLFTLIWTFSILWQYIVPWFVGALASCPNKLAHYMGVQRGFLAAGEAICFGVDSIEISYVAFAAAILGFYAAGIVVLGYLGAYHITETSCDENVEDGPVAPGPALEKSAL